jgi:cullin 1
MIDRLFERRGLIELCFTSLGVSKKKKKKKKKVEKKKKKEAAIPMSVNVNFAEKWRDLCPVIQEVLDAENGGLSLEVYLAIYRCGFDMCVMATPNRGRELHDALKVMLTEYLKLLLRDDLSKERSPVDFLSAYGARWECFEQSIRFLNLAFRPLNEQWVKSVGDEPGQNGVPAHTQNHAQNQAQGGANQAANGDNVAAKEDVYSVDMLAWWLWKREVLEGIKERLRHAIFELIKREREGEDVDRETIAKAVTSYIELGKINKNTLLIYKTEFERQFLDNTREHYTRVTTQFLAENSLSSYLKLAERRLEAETLLAQRYVHPDTLPQHTEAINHTIIVLHKHRLEGDCKRFLTERRIDDLRRMFTLLERIGELQMLLEPFFEHAKDVGDATFDGLHEASVEAKRDASKRTAFARRYVDSFLDIYNQFRDVIEEAFNSHQRFQQSLDRASRQIINNNKIHRGSGGAGDSQESARFAAIYAHTLLTDRSQTVESIAPKCDGVTAIYQFLEAKDSFHHFYKRQYRMRLLGRTSTSTDMETLLATKLKAVAPYDFVSALNCMSRDLDRSRTESTEFNQQQKSSSSSALAAAAATVTAATPLVEAIVVTRASWPIDTHELKDNLQLPPEIEAVAGQFHAFYRGKHTSRSLQWLHESSKAVIDTLWLKKGRYQITVNHYQLAVFLAFNDVSDPLGRVKYGELRRQLAIDDETLGWTIESLVGGKVRLLQRKPTSGAFTDDTFLRLNPKFAAPRRVLDASVNWKRRNISVPALDAEQARIIREQRNQNTQAAIVRIMKARRMLSHQQLVAETSKQTVRWFPTEIARIKHQIEFLINHSPPYLERVASEDVPKGEAPGRYYRYLA